MKVPTEHLLVQIASLSLTARAIYGVLGVFLIRSVFGLAERTLIRRLGHGDRRYRARKTVTSAAYALILIFIMVLFQDRLKQIGLAVGLFGAGVVVALQDIIASLGGFVAIGLSNLYRVGDRVQINDTKGDVVDISVMRTTLMETGNWVSGDLYNGRIVQIPNSVVLKGLVFNYSRGFRFVWDEIKIRFKSHCDQWQAREMLLRVGKEIISEYLSDARVAWKHILENYSVENPMLEPTVTLQASIGTLEFSLSYIVDYTQRTVVKDRLYTMIVDEVANSHGTLEWSPSSSTTVVLPPGTTDLRAPMELPVAVNGSTR